MANMDYELLEAAGLGLPQSPIPYHMRGDSGFEDFYLEDDFLRDTRLDRFSRSRSFVNLPSGLSSQSSIQTTYTAIEPDPDEVIRILEEPLPAAVSWISRIPVLSITTFLSLMGYLGSLCKGALNADRAGALWVPKVFVLAQWLDSIPTITDFLLSMSTTLQARARQRPKLRLMKCEQKVDLLIAVCKEPLDLIMDTVVAACRIDWPTDKYRIIVCDDGKDQELAVEVVRLRIEYPFLHYYSRDRRTPNGFKAGNTNDTIKMLANEDEPARPDSLRGQKPHPYVSCIDADMIVDKDYLRALMAHIYQDDKIGMVGLPQEYYNIPVNDPLYDNLTLQHQGDQIGRDKLDAAWCVGSGFVFPREAWHQVGGFQETSMCEDLIFGWALNGHGWKTAHVDERLQSGVQPESFVSHLKQRRRWYIGGMQNSIWLKFGRNEHLKQMSWVQWWAAFNQMHKPFTQTILKALVLFANIVCLWVSLFFHHSIIDAQNPDNVQMVLFFFMAYTVLTRVAEHNAARNVGYGMVRRRQVANAWKMIHLSHAAILEVSSYFTTRKRVSWQPTAAAAKIQIAPLNERSAAEPRKHLGRLEELCYQEAVGLYGILFFIMLWPACSTIKTILSSASSNTTTVYMLITGVMFPGLRLEQAFAFLSPIWYILFPPKMKVRRAYMCVDAEKTWRPYDSYRGVRFTSGMHFLHITPALATFWAIFAWCYIAWPSVGSVGNAIRLPVAGMRSWGLSSTVSNSTVHEL